MAEIQGKTREGVAYKVRVNPRAKRVILKMRPVEGLIVVVPRRGDLKRVPRILESRREWIGEALRRLESRGLSPDPVLRDTPPEKFELRAVGEAWRVEYAACSGAVRLRANAGERVLVAGEIGDIEGIRGLLKDFCRDRARALLTPRLYEQAARVGREPARVSYRWQRSRWASCSARGTLSLNVRLAFLPWELARYVMVHELCHLAHLNHSKDFWDEVARFEPDWRRLDKELSQDRPYAPRFFF